MALFNPGTEIVQNAFVVNDLDASCQIFHQVYGAGPFFVTREMQYDDVIYRGRVVPVCMSAALCQLGNLNIELIQLHSDGPSCFRDVFAEGQQGLHHVAVFAKDFFAEKARFVQAGFDIAMEFSPAPDTSVFFVDMRPHLGHMLEVYQDTPIMRELYAMFTDAAQGWDGSELIRPLAL